MPLIGQPGETGTPARTRALHSLAGLPREQPQHFLGLDLNARDVFSRVVYGSRVSLVVGFSSVTFAIVVGTLLGCFPAMPGAGSIT